MGKGQRERRRLAAATDAHHSSSSPPFQGASSFSSFSNTSADPTHTPPPPNYASRIENNFADFRHYLHVSGNLGQSYILYVDYNLMLEFGGLDLTIATCNDRKACQHDWRKRAARQFLKDKFFGDEHGRIKLTSLKYMDFPDSMRKLEHFLEDGDLVKRLSILNGNLAIDSPTSRGRNFPLMLIAALLDSHSKGFFWDGEFDIADIVVFDYELHSKRIEILRKPVEAGNWTKIKCDEAKVKDMWKVAALIKLAYRKCWPLYFDELINDLETVTAKEVGTPLFRKYLSCHVALMTTNARRRLELDLYSTYKNCDVPNMPCMHTKPTMRLAEWSQELKKAREDCLCRLLNGVFNYKGGSYGRLVIELLRFKRNLLEHGGDYISPKPAHLFELELFAADVFSEFLPSLVRTLLESGLMEKFFAGVWEAFMSSAGQ